MFAKENFVETRRPTLEASTLPGACYTAEAWYRAEVERIFLREWLLVGRAEQIPDPGDYMTEAIVGETVLLVRGRDALIRAFSPSCRHRGTKIVSGHGNCRAFVCPYHRWTYALDGELVGTPDMDPPKNFDKSKYGLLPIRLEIWEGFLFVNFDERARPLRDHLGDLPGVRHVRVEPEGAASHPGNLSHDTVDALPAGLLVFRPWRLHDVGHHHVGAFARQPRRDRAADAAAAAGARHDRHLAREIVHASTS